MTMKVVAPARISVAKSVLRSANSKYWAIALPPVLGRRSASEIAATSSLPAIWLLPARSSLRAPPPVQVVPSRPPLLVLAPVEPEELHLDEATRVELELARLERRPLRLADRRELEHDVLVALDEGVDEELVGAGLELEVLEAVDVERDRQ